MAQVPELPDDVLCIIAEACWDDAVTWNLALPRTCRLLREHVAATRQAIVAGGRRDIILRFPSHRLFTEDGTVDPDYARRETESMGREWHSTRRVRYTIEWHTTPPAPFATEDLVRHGGHLTYHPWSKYWSPTPFTCQMTRLVLEHRPEHMVDHPDLLERMLTSLVAIELLPAAAEVVSEETLNALISDCARMERVVVTIGKLDVVSSLAYVVTKVLHGDLCHLLWRMCLVSSPEKCMMWLIRDSGFGEDYKDYAMKHAAIRNRVALVKLLANELGEPATTHTFTEAMEHGATDVMTWLHHEYKLPVPPGAMELAARHGWRDSIDWLLKRGFTLSEEAAHRVLDYMEERYDPIHWIYLACGKLTLLVSALRRSSLAAFQQAGEP